MHSSGLTREERQSFSRRGLGGPVLLFLALTSVWLLLQAGIMAAPVWLALALAPLAGLATAMLFVVGHDAAHNSFTRNRRLNQVIGRLAFLPSLHAFSLWDLSHNRTHHRFNNVRGIDYVWEPMSPDDYRASPPVRRTVYRGLRHPIGIPFYYLLALWAPRLFVPIGAVIGRTRAVYWMDAAVVLGFLALHVTVALRVGTAFGKTGAESVLLAVVLPFLVWNALISFVIFLHHTHPSVAWYRDEASRVADQGALRGTACVRFPFPFDRLSLNIMEHGAHHLASGVPLYRLRPMQQALERQGGVVSWRFSWRAFLRICRRCQLYDYDHGCWLSFPRAGTDSRGA